jgi:hypothetical protein
MAGMAGVAEAMQKGEAAMAKGDDKEAAIAEALDCPCVAGLKDSSCGAGFVTALSCFMRAPEAERAGLALSLYPPLSPLSSLSLYLSLPLSPGCQLVTCDHAGCLL